jgi:hypothetical protein
MSSLTDVNTIKNSRKLKHVLDNLYATNPRSIELLQFYHYIRERKRNEDNDSYQANKVVPF